jgi:CheY-like chemotaxis protein
MRERPLILLIDDEEIFLEIASTKLQEDGFDTLITHAAEEALRRAEELQPDLVLSDIYMPPGPNGWELALQLRHNPKTRDIPIAFFSSLRDPWMEVSQEAREAIRKELAGIQIFSKMDDVDRLGAVILPLIKK